MLLEFLGTYKSNNWRFIFTDGSKTECGVSFAVVDENGNTLSKGLLPDFASVFSAEATAIARALAAPSKRKTVICTDSLSTLTAITNTKNKTPIIVTIRDKLIKNQGNIKLLWVPGHVGIKGNEDADAAAKNAVNEPLLTHFVFNKRDTKRHIQAYAKVKQKEEWFTYTHYYKSLNPDGTAPFYPQNVSNNMRKAFTRLRLGHTLLTHGHLFNKDSPPQCHLCNSAQTLTMQHLVYDCTTVQAKLSSLSPNSQLSQLLSLPSIQNIKIVYSLLSSLELINKL